MRARKKQSVSAQRLRTLLNELNKQKRLLDAQRPLNPTALQRLMEYLDVEWTYHSNAIEGSTITLRETDLILNRGLTIAGKSLREHLEVINHKRAIDWVKAFVRRKTPVTEQTVKRIHALVLTGINDREAGRYRRQDVRIGGSRHEPPPWQQVSTLMKQFDEWLGLPPTAQLPPVIRAAEAHQRLTHIHPFVDGNGRTARLLMNLLLLRDGYPITVIRNEDRLAYYDALEHADLTGDTNPLVAFVAQQVRAAFKLYLSAVAGINELSKQPAQRQRKL